MRGSAWASGAISLVVLIATIITAALQNGTFKPRFPGTSVPGSSGGDGGWGGEKPSYGSGGYLLCFWNVENFFDDEDDGRKTKGDEAPDSWFAHNPEALAQKLTNLCKVLLPLNDGKGPDILCLAEVESERAAELLQKALNEKLSDSSLHYTTVLYENPSGGRHIANAIITRLPVDKDRTQLLGKRLRILEARITINDHTLVLITSHWTSKLSDKTGAGRAKYAGIIQGRYRAIFLRNPKVDLLVCGDFNDDPDEPSVTDHLRAIDDPTKVKAESKTPYLFNLMARAWKNGEATWIEGRKRHLFDQICISPGLMDQEGWACDVNSATIIKQIAYRNGAPNRFGTSRDKRPLSVRGASDHFPVTVRLTVQ